MSKYKQVTIVLIIIFISNLTISSLKIFIGQRIHSEGITADGFQSLTDAASNIIGLIGVKIASRPADISHPYGHKKYETLASLFIGILLLIITFRIVGGAIMWFIRPTVTDVTGQSILVVIISLSVNVFVALFEYLNAKRLHSDILLADSLNTRSDVFVSAGILLTLFLIRAGVSNVIDPVASLVIAGVIIYASTRILQTASGVLVDKRFIDAEIIREVVLSIPEVKAVNNIRSRGRDDDIHIDLDIVIDPDMNVEETHILDHKIENKLREVIDPDIDLSIHLEPDTFNSP